MFSEFIRKRFDYTQKLLRVKDAAMKERKISKLLFAYYNYKLGSSIAYNTKWESPPYFPHGARRIFISGGAKIGESATIFQHVTIGSNTLKDSPRYGCPVIGKNCYIGAGAQIIGKVVIGDNVRIGAGAVVVKDVPDNCVFISQPCRVIQRDVQDNTFYSYKDGKMIMH